ncbi:hypothetical protein BGZ70_007267 [Mortierella alpina]|uniref:Uncharacterized protein n=1 Tax=Mortierella alpina TaxID=64518 RepID=A0A9P6J8K3_MORAP|nr:hypothetical protein BGZ70_007267 [Mortierella alpina]
MKISAATLLALSVSFVASSPISKKSSDSSVVHGFGKPRYLNHAVRDDTSSEAVFNPAIGAFSSSKSKRSHTAVEAAGDEHNPYVWDFETYSQANYYGDRQRFNGDGCWNFQCSLVRSYKGLPDMDYTFYDKEECEGTVLLHTTEEKMESMKQPFKPCSVMVKKQHADEESTVDQEA